MKNVRATLTLYDDLVTKLKAEARRADRPCREIVNEMMGRGLASSDGPLSRSSTRFELRLRFSRALQPGAVFRISGSPQDKRYHLLTSIWTEW